MRTREGVLVGTDFAAMSLVVAVVAMMGDLATALAAEFVRYATSDVMFAFGAFLSFVEDVLVAEFATSRAASLVVLALRFIVVFAVFDGFVFDLLGFMVLLVAVSH